MKDETREQLKTRLVGKRPDRPMSSREQWRNVLVQGAVAVVFYTALNLWILPTGDPAWRVIRGSLIFAVFYMVFMKLYLLWRNHKYFG